MEKEAHMSKGLGIAVLVVLMLNLLATGYVQESVSGLVLTDIGVWCLDRERAKKRPT